MDNKELQYAHIHERGQSSFFFFRIKRAIMYIEYILKMGIL